MSSKGGGKRASKKDTKKAANKGKKGAAANKKDVKNTKKDPKAKKDPKNAKKDPKNGKAAGGKKDTKKGGKGKGGNKDKANKGSKAKNNNNNGAPLKVDIGPPVILPEEKEFITDIPALTEFALTDDDNVAAIQTQFEEFEKLLKDRKKACLTHARTLIASDTDDTPPICIDITGMKRMINSIGTKPGERDYDRMATRIRCLDKIKELMAYEAKHASVTKERQDTSAEIIEKEIADGEKVLAEAEPVLQKARDLLKTINKSSLDEIRALPKPHKLIVKTVQACAIMVGTPESELNGWGNVKKLLKPTFVNSLVEFQARDITKETRDVLESKYLGTTNDDMDESDKLTYEAVNKANGIAGNLVSWIEAQLKYNEFIPKVEPMQKKLEGLRIQLASIEGIVDKFDTAIAELDKRITNAKQEMRDNGRAFSDAAQECD